MQKSVPRISVVINNYNYGHFIRDAIESVLRQDFHDYELIVVDDASTDHSREVIASYGSRVTAVFLEHNGGQGAAMNAGFERSQGDLICFLDSDDFFMRDKLSCVAEASAQYPDAILFCNQGYKIDQNGDRITDIFPARLRYGSVRNEILRHGEVVVPPNSFLTYRRRFLAKVMPLSPLLTRYGADYQLQMLAGIMGEMATIAKALTVYRAHDHNCFHNLDFNTPRVIRRYYRIVEREYYCVNRKLAELGMAERLDLMRNRYHRQRLFIFRRLGLWRFLLGALFNPVFKNVRERWDYICFGISHRLEYEQKGESYGR